MGYRLELPAIDGGEKSEVELHEIPTAMLFTAIVNIAQEHRSMRTVLGRLAAELHQRDAKAWTYDRIAHSTGIPSSTIHRWAKPYLGGDPA